MRFFAFTLPLEEWYRWSAALPVPSYQKGLTSSEGAKIQIIYELKHRSTTAGDWYGLDRLRKSYERVINGVIFNDHASINTDVSEGVGERYRPRQLQAFPIDDRSYPAIIRWANSKRGFRRAAFTYAKRLKYEGMLTYPAIMASLYALNEKLSTGERFKARVLEKLAKDILDRSVEWLEKLPPEELRAVRVDLGKRRGEQLQAEKIERIEEIKAAISTGDFTKPGGTVNQSKLSEFLGLHRNTIRNLIPFVLTVALILLWIRPTLLPNPLFPPPNDGIERRVYSSATI